MKKLRKANSTKSADFLNSKEKSAREVYTSKFSDLARYIKRYVEHPDFKQNEIADKLEMKESQVSLWLSGMHNLTLKSILKLESASNIQILNPAIWETKSNIKRDISDYLVSSKVGMSEFIEKIPEECKATAISSGSYFVVDGMNVPAKSAGNIQNAMAA